MKITTLSAAVAATFVFAQSAHAHGRAYGHEHHRHHVAYRSARGHHRRLYAYASEQQNTAPFGFGAQQGFGGWNFPTRTAAYDGGAGRRPAAWCGWQMRQLVGGDPGPSYNLARNWAHWGRSGPAGVGAVVVWSHHVGRIVGQENGQWIIESGNDGHALRTRVRSIAGAIAIRWG
jgi:hypothetical protein